MTPDEYRSKCIESNSSKMATINNIENIINEKIDFTGQKVKVKNDEIPGVINIIVDKNFTHFINSIVKDLIDTGYIPIGTMYFINGDDI